MKRWLLIILTVFLLCTGCAESNRRKESRPCRVVTEILVTLPEQGTTLRRYTEQDKMNHVLRYLRLLRLSTRMDAPDSDAQGRAYQITLYFSDGAHAQYLQKGDSHISIGQGPWKRIDPDMGSELPLLLAAIPSDT